jgi:hypothetical protein
MSRRQLYGPVKEEECWRIRNIKEIKGKNR